MQIFQVYTLLLTILTVTPLVQQKDTGGSNIPIPIYPYRNALTNNDRPNFIWRSVSTADSYKIIVKEIIWGGMDTFLIINVNTTDTFYVPGTSLGTGEYIWQVASFIDTGGISDYCLPIYFRVDISPPAILSTSPTGYINTPKPTIRAIYSDAFSGIFVGKNLLILDNDTVNAEQNSNSIWFVPSYDLTENIHNVTVIVFDSANNKVEHTWTFEVDHTPPATPDIIAPSYDEYINSSNATLVWHEVTRKSAPVHYEIIIATDSLFQNILVDTLNVSDTSIYLNNLSEGRYYWYVCSQDEAGNNGDCSSTSTFVIDITPPDAPTLIYPANNSFINTPNPTFIWSSSPENANILYRFTLSTVPYKSTALDTTIPDTFINVQLTEGERCYFWTVRAIDQAGNASSAVIPHTFKLDTTSPLILNTSVKNDTFYSDSIINLRVIFSENNQIDTANTYILFDSTRVNYEIFSDTIRSNIIAHNTDSAMIQIHLVDIAGNSCDTSIAFGVDYIPPEVPQLITPQNNDTIFIDTVTFAWTQSVLKSPVRYHLQCSIDSSFNFTVIDTTLSDTVLILNSLPENTYYWHVRAFDLAGNSSTFSAPNKFTIITTSIKERPVTLSLTTKYLFNSIVFEFHPAPDKEIFLVVYDPTGRTVYRTTVKPTNKLKFYWNNSKGDKLPSGPYYYQIKTGKYNFEGKLIKY